MCCVFAVGRQLHGGRQGAPRAIRCQIRQASLPAARNSRAAESSAGRAVSQVHDARAERARLDQFHVDTVISREERDAAADRDRMDE
jgi:hypothetical protein